MSTQTTAPHPMSALRRSGLRRDPRSGSVAAVILEDGTVRPLSGRSRSRVSRTSHGWSSGTVSGEGWILWWERRELD
jgi:hypothetical protein